MVDVCRWVDVDALMSDQPWGYNEFHSALRKHSDQVRLSIQTQISLKIRIFNATVLLNYYSRFRVF